MTLAYLTINLDAFTGDDHPPVPSYSTITLDPGADHIDAATNVIHVRTIVVSLDRQGKAATANGVPCVDGKVPVVVGVAYAVSAPNVLRGGPHYIPALTAGQVVDLSDYITPGAPLTPDQAAILTARIEALETTPPDHGALTGLGDDDHTQYALADGTRGAFAAPLGADDNYVTDAEKAALHAHSNKAALDLVSGTNTGDQVLPTWSTIAGKPAVVAAGATQADARTAIGAGTSSLVIGTGAGDAKAGNYQPTAANISDSTTTGRALLTAVDAAAARTSLGLGTAATTASTAYATAAQGTTADGAAQKSANLSDLANAGTARTNLGLGDSAVVGALPIPDPGAFYPTDTLTAALQLIGGRERYGTGSPEGVVTAAVGTYYTDTAITNGAMRWAKKTGTGNTGWRCVEGDTGWRDIRALYSENVVEAAAFSLSSRIIRVGDTVQYLGRVKPSGAVVGVARGNVAGIQGVISTIPAGFMPLPSDNGPKGSVSVALGMQGQLANTASTSRLDLYMSASVAGVWAGTDVIFLSGSWPTRDAWPTTLPGVAG